MFKSNFSKAASFMPKAYYLVVKETFAILALFLLPDNAFVYTSCNQGSMKHEHYLVVSIHWVQLIAFWPWFVTEAGRFEAGFIKRLVDIIEYCFMKEVKGKAVQSVN